MKLIQGTIVAILLLALSEASGRKSKKDKRRSKSIGNEEILEMLNKAHELPPPYKIPIKTIDVEIDHTPRPPLFRNDDSSDSLSEMGRENKDFIYVGVFDKLKSRYHILAPLNDYGEPHIANYDEFFPESNTPIGIRKVQPRHSSSDTSSSEESESSTSSGEDILERRRRARAVSLGTYPDNTSKKRSERRERRILLDAFMELKKSENFGKAEERARLRRQEREKAREKEARKEEKRKKKEKALQEKNVVQIRRPIPPSEQKEMKDKKKKEAREKDKEKK